MNGPPMTAILLALALLPGTAARAGDPVALAGPWRGTLSAPGASVEIYLDLEAGQGGSVTGRLTIPALGIRDQALSEVALEGDRFSVSIPEVPGDARFDGIVAGGGRGIAGKFTQAGQSYPFEIVRGAGAERDSGEFALADVSEIVGRASREIDEGYLDPARGAEIAADLRAALGEGLFDAVASGAELASAVTGRLAAESGDLHLRLLYHLESGEEGTSEAGGPGATYGFVAAEILDGNVGYLDLREFAGAEEAAALADAVMARLAGVEALVIDLGRNQGGSPFMVAYLSGYFFAAPTHLVSTRFRGRGEPVERWTGRVGGKVRPDLPLYVLTSARTVSAAESFIFGLRNHGRIAAVVGERTAGGGHMARGVYLGSGFTLMVPFARTFDPRTGAGWEGDGLEPDVAVDYERALDRALALIAEASAD